MYAKGAARGVSPHVEWTRFIEGYNCRALGTVHSLEQLTV